MNLKVNQETQIFAKSLLTKINVFGRESNANDVTRIYYKNLSFINNDNTIIDELGYLLKKGTCSNLIGQESILSSHRILQKIKFNTGGSVLYDFEPHTYSNPRNTLEDFQERNLDNYIFTNYTPVYNNQLGSYVFEVGTGIKKIFFGFKGSLTTLSITRPGQSDIQGASTYGSSINPNLLCLNSLRQLETYGITGLYRLPNFNPASYNNLLIKGINYPSEANTNKFLYSHGHRIKRIAYFEGDVSQTLLQNDAAVPNAEREISFNYSADTSEKVSSGKTHTSEPYGSNILDSYILYEKVTAKVRGVGKSEYYFNNVAENADYWRSLNSLPKKIKSYNNANQLLKEQQFDREFKYYSNLPNLSKVDREPIVYKEQVKTKEYIGSNIAEFISNITNDTISRQVIYSKNTNLKTNEITEMYNNFIKINKTYVLDKTDNYFNGVKTMSSKNTYDANANLKFQEVSKNNQPFQKVGNENTLFNSRGNVREYIQLNGTFVSNIYGHEDTKLVAQLVNAKYTDVSITTINNISKFSKESWGINLFTPIPPTYNEANLISSLNLLRTNHPNAFITTYIYNSLIGVKSITDPNSDTQTFEYDNQNRLERIKDHQGNTLNSYQYNFKN